MNKYKEALIENKIENVRLIGKLNRIKELLYMIISTTNEDITIARCNMILQLLEGK